MNKQTEFYMLLINRRKKIEKELNDGLYSFNIFYNSGDNEMTDILNDQLRVIKARLKEVNLIIEDYENN